MPRFFVTADAISNGRILLTGSDALHISRSLRMHPGETITVCDMQRREYCCRLSAFSPETVEAVILSVRENNSEPPYFITLCMALPKGDKMEWIIQKSVELGVSRIVPFISSRCVVKLGPADGEKKRVRWQKIADAAAGQCGRGILPQVSVPCGFSTALERAAGEMEKGGFSFFCYEGETDKDKTLPHVLASLRQCSSPSSPRTISFFVGAEGGFSVEEAAQAAGAGLPAAGLGRRILRCETAPLFVLSCLSYALEL